MHSITEFLDLEDTNITVADISISGTTKTITLITEPELHYCPVCASRMHSRGIKSRTIQHPILQDHYQVILILKQRRWRCTNKSCLYESNETFRFVGKHRRTTNATDMLIIQEFRDFSISAAAIARKFHTSDTHVTDIFDRYVHLDRLPLTDIISIDEVNVDLDPNCKYALVIQDFYTGEPIDLLISRRTSTTEPYFANIPIEERIKVRYLISDMYNEYIKYVDKYFPNAVSVVDSFHVVQWMLSLIDEYYRGLLKQYRERDREAYLEKHPEGIPKGKSIPPSDEVYLLKNYRWIVLTNRRNITYQPEARWEKHFRCLMNTYDKEDSLFARFPRLRTLRDLKEMYIDFNTRNAGNPDKARPQLEELIKYYKECGDSIFVRFSETLERYIDPIINSFVMVKRNGSGGLYDSRLSNGPIESLNRVPKDMKRNGRGYKNFDHFRNRFLYSMRKNPVLNGTGKSEYTYFDMTDDF